MDNDNTDTPTIDPSASAAPTATLDDGPRAPVTLVLDGPLGSELSRRGVSTAGPAWSASANLTAPEVVAAIHRSHRAAGARLLRANTFRARPEAFDGGGAWEASLLAAVRLARAAADGLPVYGSVAPFGDCYAPAPPDLARARASHERVLAALLAAGVDGVAFETFPSVPEALLVADLAAALPVPAWISLTGGPSGDVLSPEALADGAAAIAARGLAVAVNCVAAELVASYTEAARARGVSLGLYPNAARWMAPRAPREALVAAIRAAAPAPPFVSVCCGGDVEDLRALALAYR